MRVSTGEGKILTSVSLSIHINSRMNHIILPAENVIYQSYPRSIPIADFVMQVIDLAVYDAQKKNRDETVTVIKDNVLCSRV